MTTPPVKPSPQPPANPDDGSDSGVRQLTEREARLIREAEVAKVAKAAEDAKEASAKRTRWLQIGTIVTALTLAFGVFFKLEARGQENTAQQIAPVVKDAAETKAKVDKHDTQITDLRIDVARIVQMNEMVVKRMGMEPPPRPATDGGAP